MSSRILKYYFDLLSQPSRAVYILLEQSKIPYEKCPVALRKFEQKSEDYIRNVNRFGKVPCIVHGDFKLAESIAIFRYLDRDIGFQAGQHSWYPKDKQVRARVDEFLEWQHLNVRAQCALYFMYVWMNPLLGLEVNPQKEQSLRKKMETDLDSFEKLFLDNGKKPFIAGDELTFADVIGACEIEQPKMAGFDPREGRPVLADWMERVRIQTNPHYDEAHKVLYKFMPKTIKGPGA
ncbi:glutathione S-transferase theta-1-like [Uranotaenia lowii]|uniref:glutathione S-transferase theta-1-like n=1 Tax=Uranotaenia lowii TaxID=190385 RepID=UPI0024789777|nr:glutathione S-transferase theta-1-like [Uranotaenia lowii]XP_055585616.1 glutathione S-transferase theta-1-like [Uranotaenia lowii]XP_055585617.1 glutathione S-transferase theta-1-like [Uranotaenia lowii]